MNFEQRRNEAKAMLVDFFSGFSAPRGLDDDQQSGRITAIADAFARRMPTHGDFRAAVESVFAKVRDTHLSNSWPPQAVFVMAMPKGEVMGRKAQESFMPNELEVAGKKVQMGEGLADRFVWGSLHYGMVTQGHATKDQMDKYRIASVNRFKATYRHQAYEFMRRKYGDVVTPYFDPRERVMQSDLSEFAD